MLTHRGFSASIISDGIELPHYKEAGGHDGRTKQCWIPSVEGARWSIVWRNDEGEDGEIASCGHVFVDGKDVASAIMRPGRALPVERNGAKTSSGRVKPFVFQKLKLTDDDSVADENDPRSKDIGTIRLEIKLVRLGKAVPLKPVCAEEVGVMHEKAKKVGVHATSFGEPKRVPKSRGVTNAPWDPEDTKPHVTFIFGYRSKEMLQAQGVISVPKRTENKRKLFIDDDDDCVDAIQVEDEGGEEQGVATTSSSTRVSASPPSAKRSKVDHASNLQSSGSAVGQVDSGATEPSQETGVAAEEPLAQDENEAADLTLEDSPMALGGPIEGL